MDRGLAAIVQVFSILLSRWGQVKKELQELDQAYLFLSTMLSDMELGHDRRITLAVKEPVNQKTVNQRRLKLILAQRPERILVVKENYIKSIK